MSMVETWPGQLPFCFPVNAHQCDQIWWTFATLAKFYQSGAYFWAFGIILILLWQKCFAIGQVFVAVDGQIFYNNLAIWSHWSPSPSLSSPSPSTSLSRRQRHRRHHRRRWGKNKSRVSPWGESSAFVARLRLEIMANHPYVRPNEPTNQLELILCHLFLCGGLEAVWPDLAKFRHFGKILKVFGQFLVGTFSILQTFEPTWVIFMLRANFHCCKWPKIEN